MVTLRMSAASQKATRRGATRLVRFAAGGSSRQSIQGRSTRSVVDDVWGTVTPAAVCLLVAISAPSYRVTAGARRAAACHFTIAHRRCPRLPGRRPPLLPAGGNAGMEASTGERPADEAHVTATNGISRANH